MAVVRVKRRLSEEPAEALLFNYKRIRSDGSDGDASCETVKSIFTFAATIDNKDDLTSSKIAQVLEQKKRQKNPKYRDIDIVERTRKEHEKATKNSRFKLVNSHRTTFSAEDLEKEESDSEAKESGKFNVFDVENEYENDDNIVMESPALKEYQQTNVSCNGELLTRTDATDKKEPKYVYDLYYTSEFNSMGLIVDNSLSIEKFLDPHFNDLVPGSPEYQASDDDEDSNDENYYKNDYPDEDSDFESGTFFWRDYDEANVSEWLTTCRIHSDESSDDSEPKPSEVDIYYHGESYARFKAKLKRDLEKLENESSETE